MARDVVVRATVPAPAAPARVVAAVVRPAPPVARVAAARVAATFDVARVAAVDVVREVVPRDDTARDDVVRADVAPDAPRDATAREEFAAVTRFDAAVEAVAGTVRPTVVRFVFERVDVDVREF